MSLGPQNTESYFDGLPTNETGLQFTERRLRNAEKQRAELIGKKLAPVERKTKLVTSIVVFLFGFILLWAIPIAWLSIVCYSASAGFYIYTNIKIRKDNDVGFEIVMIDERIRRYKYTINAHKESKIGV